MDWREVAIILSETEMSWRKIADKVGAPKSTVSDFLRNYYAEKGSPLDKNKFFIRGKDDNQDNSSVLLISDLHAPYNHPDALDFLAELRDKYKPTRVICLGDEVDQHALSYHDSDPDLPSAGDELKKSKKVIKQLHKLFPVMDIIESNHGSLVWRKAKTHGIPRHYIRSYNDVLDIDDGWRWSFDLTIKLPNGQQCYIHHGKTNNVLRLSQMMGMCAVQGHYHEHFKIDYWSNPTGLYWGMQTGCLIDDNSYAFAYNNTNIKRPIRGTGVIVDSKPILEPMRL